MGGLIFGCNVIVLGVYMHGMFPWGKWFLSVSNESFKFSWRDVTLKNIFVKILPNQMTAQELGRLVKGFLIHPKKMVPKTLRPSKSSVAAERDGGCPVNHHCESRCSRSSRAIHVSRMQTCPYSTTWRSNRCRWMYHAPGMGWSPSGVNFCFERSDAAAKIISIICRVYSRNIIFFVNIFQNVKLEEGTFLKTSWFAVAAVWEWSSWKLGCIETRSCRMIHIYIQVSLGKPHVTACLNSPTAIHQKNDPILVQTTHLASQLSPEPQNPLLKVYFQNHFLRRDDAPLRLNLMTFYFQVKLVIVSLCQSIQSM